MITGTGKGELKIKFIDCNGFGPDELQGGPAEDANRVNQVTIANMTLESEDYLDPLNQDNIGIHILRGLRWLIYNVQVIDFTTCVSIDGTPNTTATTLFSGAILNRLIDCAFTQDRQPATFSTSNLYPKHCLHFAGGPIPASNSTGRAEANTAVECELYGENNVKAKNHTMTEMGDPAAKVLGPYDVELGASLEAFQTTGVHVLIGNNFIDRARFTVDIKTDEHTPTISFVDAASAPDVGQEFEVLWLENPGQSSVFFEHGQGSWLYGCAVGGHIYGVEFGDRKNDVVGGYEQICDKALLFFKPGQTTPEVRLAASNNYVAPNFAFTKNSLRRVSDDQGEGNFYDVSGQNLAETALLVDYQTTISTQFFGPSGLRATLAAQFVQSRQLRFKAFYKIENDNEPTDEATATIAIYRANGNSAVAGSDWDDQTPLQTFAISNTLVSSSPNVDETLETWMFEDFFDDADTLIGNRQYAVVVKCGTDTKVTISAGAEFSVEETTNV